MFHFYLFTDGGRKLSGIGQLLGLGNAINYNVKTNIGIVFRNIFFAKLIAIFPLRIAGTSLFNRSRPVFRVFYLKSIP